MAMSEVMLELSAAMQPMAAECLTKQSRPFDGSTRCFEPRPTPVLSIPSGSTASYFQSSSLVFFS